MIKGKPLPPVEEVTAPDTQRLDELIALWNANCPKFYVGLLEAGRPNSRFLYDKATLTYSIKPYGVLQQGRKITRQEVSKVYGETMKKIGAR
jgi:hypothetical protein